MATDHGMQSIVKIEQVRYICDPKTEHDKNVALLIIINPHALQLCYSLIILMPRNFSDQPFIRVTLAFFLILHFISPIPAFPSMCEASKT